MAGQKKQYLVAGSSGKPYVVSGRKRAFDDAAHFVRAGARKVCVSLVLPHGGAKPVRCFSRSRSKR